MKGFICFVLISTTLFFSSTKRPQVQERLTIQISSAMKEALRHNDVAVVVVADHLCVASRGIKDTNSSTVTGSYSGKFENEAIKREFLSHIHDVK